MAPPLETSGSLAALARGGLGTGGGGGAVAGGNDGNGVPAVTTRMRARTQITTNTTPFFNRDLSWLDFNQRVLQEALDPRTPLLERVKFLAIYSSNSDEFFMKRVGLLRRKIATKSSERSHDGLTAEQQYLVVQDRLRE